MKKFLFSMIWCLVPAAAAVAQGTFQMAGPYEVVARDGQYRSTKAGSERDMKAALDFSRAGNSTEATRIIDAYAEKLQRLDGHDAPLCLIQCYDLLQAMTLVKSHQTPAWAAMVRRAMIPTIEKFDADSPYANGNWGAIVNRCRMAAAVFLADSALYRQAVAYYLHANDNGSLPRYISETGQCQETGRDQAHVQLGLEALAQTCEMAWQQGDDLWGALDNRLLKGFEYTARYNLGYDVPFETWTDCTGLYCEWTEPGQMSRGKLWDIYELPYKHYVREKGLKMPYTERIVKGQKPKVKEYAKLHQVFTYQAPKGAPLKHDYDVYIRPRSSEEWTRIDTYMAKVNAPVGINRHAVREISYAFFDFTGDVFVRVVCKKKKYSTARIRPDYRGVIANVQNDSTLQFLLFQPENVSVEFDGDITDNLLLFTSKPPVGMEEARREAAMQGRNFISYEPGLYRDETIRVPSNTTVYLAGGSYYTGTLAIEDAENVCILGRGIARPANGLEGCHVHRSKNVLIDGMVLNTCPVGGSDGVTLHDVRSISHPGWGDGLNVFASSNVLYDRVFCRNSDDCTTAYATRKGFSGSARNIHMRNSILWADVAHPIFIGIHGNSERGDTIEKLLYENIDILCQAEPQVDYQGCMAINCGDNNLVRDVVFDNIRIEQIYQGCLLQVKVGYNSKYCTAPGREVDNVTFRNIRYYGETPFMSVMAGYDENRRVKNIVFENLKINGRVISDDMAGKPRWYSTADYVPMFVGNHVENVVFTRSDGSFNPDLPLAYCASKVGRALEALRPYDFTMMPRNILDGEERWNHRKAKAEEWCSGFWPGILWMDYGLTTSEAVRKAAEGYTEVLAPLASQAAVDHDLGFIMTNSFLKGYEQTKDEHYRKIALQAADSLAMLFNDKVGTMLSWPHRVEYYGGHNTIIDNMMNLELLLWADQQQPGSHRLRNMAVRHAETTMRNHFRPDGSSYHVAVYDTLDGHFLRGVTHQGYADNSMWSRGQAWGVYGFTMVYRYTKDRRFLDFARKVADAYLRRLKATSDDWVPIWDMDAPVDHTRMTKQKDASAACIVASALLELCQYSDDTKQEVVGDKTVDATYYQAALGMLADLSSPRYQSGQENVAFLLHSTGHRPAGSEIDASIIYADYYYLEALLRLKKLRI